MSDLYKPYDHKEYGILYFAVQFDGTREQAERIKAWLPSTQIVEENDSIHLTVSTRNSPEERVLVGDFVALSLFEIEVFTSREFIERFTPSDYKPEVMELSAEDSVRVAEALLNPGEPNDALRNLMENRIVLSPEGSDELQELIDEEPEFNEGVEDDGRD